MGLRMIPNSVCFSYVSLVRPGAPALDIPYPEPLISDVRSGDIHPLIVTAGIVFTEYSSFIIEVDVFYNDKSILPTSVNDDGVNKTPLFKHTVQGNVSIVTTMRMKVTFPGEGKYIVKTVIRRGNDDPQASVGELLDSHEGHFFVTFPGGSNG
jgi:hypothetical protein